MHMNQLSEASFYKGNVLKILEIKSFVDIQILQFLAG